MSAGNNTPVDYYTEGRSAVLWRVVSRERSPNGFVTLRRCDGKEIKVTHSEFKQKYKLSKR